MINKVNRSSIELSSVYHEKTRLTGAFEFANLLDYF